MSRYDFKVDAANTKSVYHRVLSWIAPGSRVLDVGCDTGNLGACMVERGATVEGVELDAGAASEACKKLARVYTGSITDAGLTDGLGGPYDAIVFADVLEHVVDPGAVLLRVKPKLAPGGVVIASLPNVANFRVRIPLLFGRFEYTEIGILDRTHLRFFTRKTACELFTAHGYEVLEVKPAATYMPAPLLYGWPGLFATRFVVKAGVRG